MGEFMIYRRLKGVNGDEWLETYRGDLTNVMGALETVLKSYALSVYEFKLTRIDD